MIYHIDMKLGNTLRLTFPFGNTFAWGLVVLALFWGAAETIARTPAVRLRYPFPSVNSPNVTFDQGLTELDRQMAARGRVDCVVLGSSMVLNDFNPTAFQSVYQEHAQTELNCINFGVEGMTAAEAGDIARLLADIAHPRLLIYGTSARDYTNTVQDLQASNGTLLTEIPWVRYRLGRGFSLEGWLIDHSYAFHYLIGSRHWTQFWGQPLQAAPPRQAVDLTQPPDRETEAGHYQLLSHYAISADARAGLENVLKLPQQGVQVVVVEMPVHPSYLYFFDRGEADQQLFRQAVAGTAQAHRVPFWTVDAGLNLPDSMWADRNHLAPSGGAVFSQWLARQVSGAVQQGTLVLDPR
jgi:hypothetical protein